MTKLQALEIVNRLNQSNYVPAVKAGQKELGYSDITLIKDTPEINEALFEIVFKGVWFVQEELVNND